MVSLDQLLMFGAAALVLLVTPGPSVLYVTSRTLNGGARAGAMSTLGLAVGDLIQVLAVASGIAALVASSPVALAALKLAGGCYLLYLAYRCLPRAKPLPATDEPSAPPRAGPDHAFRDAVVVNALNPKSLLFFIAFLPAFIKADHGPIWAQALTLGALFVAIGVFTNGAWAAAAMVARERLPTTSGTLVQNYLPAAVFALLAVLAFLTLWNG